MTTTTDSSPVLDAQRWQRRLDELLSHVKAPGAVFAVLHGDQLVECAAGTANLETGAPVTADTLFHIASITKVYTATLAMQLVDEGALALDAPVRGYLPEFRVADADTTARLTARHLLTHTSGLDGDKEDTFGRGDDALERYVESCATLGQIHPLGATFSYCNSGYLILGRVIEVLRGKSFDAALRDHLLGPLGAARTGTLPEDLIWFPLAAGHIVQDGEPEVFHRWENHRDHAPAGGVVTTARDLLAFARMHIDGGVAADGTRILSEGSAAAMRVAQVELPDPTYGPTDWGLGWDLLRPAGGPVLAGHGGDLVAHHSRLAICPEHRFAVALLMNGDGEGRVGDALFAEALAELGIELPKPVAPPATPPTVDLDAVAGDYQTIAVRASLRPAGERLEGTISVIDEALAELLPASEREHQLTFIPIGDRQFVTRVDEDEPWMSAIFYESGGERYMHMGLRALRERR
jgi:CubicO group peptidase (beta-lactamase class C family)